ncbi:MULTISPECIES: phage neck terminator protein [pseudomallei group]|uniref:phage neck terminator protein n=1 Tax=pseudomallei group TaxID=111527 RepID=UPI0009776980|nr:MULTISPECIES: hypothetical protein [pseudomallei group]ALJ98691.1 hypothetical protein PE067_013 [Burkholderia phage PE067]NOK53475.1 hypothetical protein [Burkholderia thailandensis]OMQ49939.1 hypothetical protein AQ709_05320 [Burkholderia pseudomallei]OMQ74412.1 hypothetical protein AQ711_23075 [Burkholderia pseudomallei]OMQ77310.1 hypothetical protein AQ712_02640 [Burkholderia pseudomallei]
MPVTISITESQVFTALRSFLLGILPAGVEVVKAQGNGVGEPVGGDFVVMNSIASPRIATNVEGYTDPGTNPGTRNSMQAIEARLQLDVHGPNSGDNAAIISTLFRDEYACIQFATVNPDIQPLYSEIPRQMPFINGENQFEQRWIIELALQYNPITQTPQDFADEVIPQIVSVDAAYPPGA